MIKTVITGGPGSGKTSLVNAFENDGYAVVRESAIDVINELQEKLGYEDTNSWRFAYPVEFQMLIAEKQAEREKDVDRSVERACYDRGLYDQIGYLVLQGAKVPQRLIKLASCANYDNVFILDTIQDYDPRLETGRTEDRDESLRIRETILSVYLDYGYDPIVVPEFKRDPINDSVKANKQAVRESIYTRKKFIEDLLII